MPPFYPTKTRKSDEADELHWTAGGKRAALCGAEDQRRATEGERTLYLAPRCWTCRCLREEEGLGELQQGEPPDNV